MVGVADEDQLRYHGFQRPFHPLQVTSWVVFGGDCVVFLVFCLPIIEGTVAQVLVSIGFLVSTAVLVYVTAQATACDPVDPHVGREETELQEDDARSLPFCRMCNVTVQARSKHCRACNKCVDVFDHHCMWLNNCIGAANYNWFFATVSAVIAMIGIVLSTSLYLLVDYFVNDGFEQRVADIVIFEDIPPEFFLGMLIFMMTLNMPLFLLDLQLVFLHIFLMSQNLTTYEYIMGQRFPEDSSTANKLRRRAPKLPSCIDWIVFSRCGQRRRAKKSSSVQEIGAGSAAQSDGEARSGSSATPTAVKLGTERSEKTPPQPGSVVRSAARGSGEKVPSPPGSTVDAEDSVAGGPQKRPPAEGDAKGAVLGDEARGTHPPRRLEPIEGRPLLGEVDTATQGPPEDEFLAAIQAIFTQHDREGHGSIERSKIDAVFKRLQSTPVFREIFTQEALERFSSGGRFEYQRFLGWLYDDLVEQEGAEAPQAAAPTAPQAGQASRSPSPCRSRSSCQSPGPPEGSENESYRTLAAYSTDSGCHLVPNSPTGSRASGNGGKCDDGWPSATTAADVNEGSNSFEDQPASARGVHQLEKSPKQDNSAHANGSLNGHQEQSDDNKVFDSVLLNSKESKTKGVDMSRVKSSPDLAPRGESLRSRPPPVSTDESDHAAESDVSPNRKPQNNKVADSGPLQASVPETPPHDEQLRDPLRPEVRAKQEQQALFAAAVVLLMWMVLLVTLARLKRLFEDTSAPECPAEPGPGEELLVCEPCGGTLNLLPLFGEYEQSWPWHVRAMLYFVGLGWIFQGISEVCNEFMAAIEEITLSERTELRPLEVGGKTYRKFTVKVWNDTVANLTLMALGSSAPEILLSVIEVIFGGFKIGKLGASTIVGSAAFNLFVIAAVCVSALGPDKTKKIQHPEVFAVTTVFSLFAYFWLLIMLEVWTPSEVTSVEALITLMLFPAIVVCAYIVDRATQPDAKGSFWDIVTRSNSEKKVAPVMTRAATSSALDTDVTLVSKKMPAETRRALENEMRERELADDSLTRAARRKAATSSMIGGVTPMSSHTFSMSGGTSSYMSRSMTSTRSLLNNEELSFRFDRREVHVLESEGTVVLGVRASRNPRCEVRVPWHTEDGTAMSSGADPRYESNAGELVFRPGEPLCKTIEVKVVDDEKWQSTEEFYVNLEPPRSVGNSGPGGRPGDPGKLDDSRYKCTVKILNDDRPGYLCFAFNEVCTRHKEGEISLTVVRVNGTDGEVSCKAVLTPIPTEGRGQEKESTVHRTTDKDVLFKAGESSAVVQFTIGEEMSTPATYKVELMNSNPSVCLDQVPEQSLEWLKKHTKTCTVELLPSTNLCMQLLGRGGDEPKMDSESLKNWRHKFGSAIYCKGDAAAQAQAGYQDWAKHCISLPWKVLFACIPPANICGGKLSFAVSLGMIGALTAVIGDMATLLGCVVGIPDEITAITLVALGTSLPDTFASMIAAQDLPFADEAIGNITGSNSVNVFLGLGIPWTIAAFYWEAQGKVFQVPAGSLSFSVSVFSCCAVICVAMLVFRRRAYGGELGGPQCAARRDSVVMVLLWVTYVGLSIVQSLLSQ